MASNREKGVVFIGLGKPPGFYENIVRNEFRDSKNIELKAVGRAIPRAIRISEKLTNAKEAIYVRLISEPITLQGNDNILVVIRLRRLGEGGDQDNRDNTRDNRDNNQDNTRKVINGDKGDNNRDNRGNTRGDNRNNDRDNRRNNNPNSEQLSDKRQERLGDKEYDREREKPVKFVEKKN